MTMSLLSSMFIIGTLINQVIAGNVLILSSSVYNGMNSVEAQAAVTAGHLPVVVDDATWLGMTTADFTLYSAIVLGDAYCTSIDAVTAAETSKNIWSPAVNGNVIIDGTDPVLHGKTFLTNGAVAFAAAETGTGLYASLSCYYHGTAAGTPVTFLSGIGAFTVRGVGCYDDVHKVADHPALDGVTDEALSNWGCSVHEAFDSYPSSFLPLAIARNVDGSGSVTFADGSFGVPYIVARGKTLVPVACGNGIVETGEECDDGNTINGDLCSAQCKSETIGLPPLTVTCPMSPHVMTSSTTTCDATMDFSSLITSTEGSTVSVMPLSPYPVGTTRVTATATLGAQTVSCSFDVTVNDASLPTIGAVTVDTTGLWPPNHKMVLVKLAYTPVDNCGSAGLTCAIVNPTSSESGNGKGDGNTTPDITISDAKNVLVRSERSGNGGGRTYGVTVSCTDGAGNVATTPVVIMATVPKSKGGK